MALRVVDFQIWKAQLATAKPAVIRAFVQTHPNNAFVPVARLWLERDELDAATTPQALRGFVERYPMSSYRHEAAAKLTRLESGALQGLAAVEALEYRWKTDCWDVNRPAEIRRVERDRYELRPATSGRSCFTKGVRGTVTIRNRHSNSIVVDGALTIVGPYQMRSTLLFVRTVSAGSATLYEFDINNALICSYEFPVQVEITVASAAPAQPPAKQ